MAPFKKPFQDRPPGECAAPPILSKSLACGLALLLLTLAAPTRAQEGRPEARPGEGEGAKFEVTLNGRELEIQAVCLFDQPSPAQRTHLALVNGIPLNLGTRRRLRFQTSDQPDGQLFWLNESGQPELVGVRIFIDTQGPTPRVVNPLAGLEAKKIAALWGILADFWDAKVQAQVAEMQPQQTVLTLTDNAADPKSGAVPPLPPGLGFLNLLEAGARQFKDLSPLRLQNALRAFNYISFSSPPFDAALLAQNKSLLYLDLSGTRLQNAPRLAELAELRYLNLDSCEGVVEGAFLGALKRLLRAELFKAPLRDLSPILNHPSLEILNANESQVATLPGGPVPRLRLLSLLNAPLPPAALQAFRQANPQCRVHHDLDRIFHEAVKDCTRIRVRTANLTLREVKESQVFEVTEAIPLAQAIGQLKIDGKQPGLTCPCSVGPFIEFYKDAALLALIAYRHGTAVEWMSGELGNWNLAAESVEFLNGWLKKHGAALPGAAPAPGTNAGAADPKYRSPE